MDKPASVEGTVRVFLYGYHGRRNTGDDAMLYAFLSIAPRLQPRMKFSVLRGEDTPVIPEGAVESTTFVPSTLFAVFKSLLAANVFAIVGGTHLTDYGLNRRTIMMRLRIVLLVGFSKLLGKKVFLLGAGLGPFRKSLPGAVARWICMRADAITVRDQTSNKVASHLGVGERTTLGFDVAALIDWDGLKTSPTEAMKHKTLGVSITPMFTLYHDDAESDRALVEKLGEALNSWMRKNPEWRVDLFVFHGRSMMTRDDDAEISEELRVLLIPQERVRIVDYQSNPLEMFKNLSRCSAFVGMKYHACLFAYLSNLPLLVIPYHPKCAALAKEIGLPDEALLPLDQVLGGEFERHLDLLTTLETGMRATLPLNVSKSRAKTAIQTLTEANGG